MQHFFGEKKKEKLDLEKNYDDHENRIFIQLFLAYSLEVWYISKFIQNRSSLAFMINNVKVLSFVYWKSTISTTNDKKFSGNCGGLMSYLFHCYSNKVKVWIISVFDSAFKILPIPVGTVSGQQKQRVKSSKRETLEL